jgi:hypothetical protein
MTHIDDWLDERHDLPPEDENERFARDWLEHFRRPAIKKDYNWLAANPLFCTYKDGKRYRCIGCSRMGDVWLTEHFDRTHGYDLRIDVADCSNWSKEP